MAVTYTLVKHVSRGACSCGCWSSWCYRVEGPDGHRSWAVVETLDGTEAEAEQDVRDGKPDVEWFGDEAAALGCTRMLNDEDW